MFSPLSTALNGLNATVARTTQAAGNIVKASSTGDSTDQNLLAVKQGGTQIAADAAVIKAVNKEQKTLIDMLA